jgi:phospholipid/cholesterol/gamma-HCH transport system substrate-binding protein
MSANRPTGGAALVKQRLAGIAFLVVLFGLVALSIAFYQKAFTPVVMVTLETDKIGNQLTPPSDVKVNGVIVGEARRVETGPDGALVTLALQPDAAERIPSNVQARLLPKTLFGEKFIDLVLPEQPAGDMLVAGSIIPQDRSEAARETEEALNNLLPLLQTLDPESVSTTLNAVSSALRDRGDRIGSNLVLVRDYFVEFNPELGSLQRNIQGTADFADTLTAATPDIVKLLDELSVVNRNLVRDQDALERFLRDTAGFARTTEGFVAENEQRFITLARESVPNLRVYERYAPGFPCLAASLAEDHRQISNAFGTLQPGLHITLEFTSDNGPYVPGDEPEYLDDAGPTCRSLGTEGRERPIPEYREGQDGYRDGQDVIPETGGRTGEPPTGPGGPYTYPDQRRKAPQDQGTGSASASAMPFSPASYDKAAVGRVVAPALGVGAGEVPDVAVLLFAPMARDTVVRVS